VRTREQESGRPPPRMSSSEGMPVEIRVVVGAAAVGLLVLRLNDIVDERVSNLMPSFFDRRNVLNEKKCKPIEIKL
jgi:hypothetical protein